jgi:hypothetical protein
MIESDVGGFRCFVYGGLAFSGFDGAGEEAGRVGVQSSEGDTVTYILHCEYLGNLKSASRHRRCWIHCMLVIAERELGSAYYPSTSIAVVMRGTSCTLKS